MASRFINRFLVRSTRDPIPADANKLRLDPGLFRLLMKTYDVPLAFVSALTQLHLPSGRGFSSPEMKPSRQSTRFSFWYVLPIRMQVLCNDTERAHVASTAGSNQMDPRHYLHLPDVRVDVRGSQIAILCEFSQTEPRSVTIVFNFMDGRWSRSVEEPQRRLLESVKMADGLGLAVDPFFIHSIFFTSSLRWWMNSLSSINDQLIAYEKRLQQEIDNETEASDVYSVVNRALHSIAAHLHRYGSELSTASDILGDIKEHHDSFSRQQAEEDQQKYYRVSKCLSQICTHMKQVRILLEELEVKLKNILALLFNRIQIANDRLMVSNGEKMHSILQATREDSEISRIIAAKQGQIAEEMQKDSVAMKTIAVTTMFFLPGTSFAAFLAMPFFAQDDYLTNGAKAWIWVVCTVPSTCVAFAFYFYWRRRDELRKKNSPYAVTGHENGRVLQRGLT